MSLVSLVSLEWVFNVALALLIVAVVGLMGWLWVSMSFRFQKGHPADRAKRQAAIALGPVTEGVPFELTGVARADARLGLHLDLDFCVPWQDIDSWHKSGVALDYEILVDDRRVEQQSVRLPRDGHRRDKTLVDVPTLDQKRRTRLTVKVTELAPVLQGTRVVARGRVTALPDNEIRELVAWVG